MVTTFSYTFTAIYLTFVCSSIVMQDTRTEAGTDTVKLCFLILGCVSEDQYANSIMHDISLTFKVQLHRLPMRHRKPSTDHTMCSQPLASTLLGKSFCDKM